MQVYWAGTDGSLWRSTTNPQSGFVQMSTDQSVVVTRMAVDDRDTLYGINSSGKPVVTATRAWTNLDLGDNSERYIAGRCCCRHRRRYGVVRRGVKGSTTFGTRPSHEDK